MDNDLESTLVRCIRKQGRRLISLRKQMKLYEHYQIDLKLLGKIFALDCANIEILVRNATHLPEFFDYEYEVEVTNIFVFNYKDYRALGRRESFNRD